MIFRLPRERVSVGVLPQALAHPGFQGPLSQGRGPGLLVLDEYGKEEGGKAHWELGVLPRLLQAGVAPRACPPVAPPLKTVHVHTGQVLTTLWGLPARR